MKDTTPDRLNSIQRASCPTHHHKTIKHIKVLVLVTSLLALSLTVFGCRAAVEAEAVAEAEAV